MENETPKTQRQLGSWMFFLLLLHYLRGMVVTGVVVLVAEVVLIAINSSLKTKIHSLKHKRLQKFVLEM